MKRPLYIIAKAIRMDWTKPSIHVKPYLDAMSELDAMTDKYGLDSADGIVRHFLVNAQGWKGPVAKSIKAELKGML